MRKTLLIGLVLVVLCGCRQKEYFKANHWLKGTSSGQAVGIYSLEDRSGAKRVVVLWFTSRQGKSPRENISIVSKYPPDDTTGLWLNGKQVPLGSKFKCFYVSDTHPFAELKIPAKEAEALIAELMQAPEEKLEAVIVGVQEELEKWSGPDSRK